MIFADCFHRLVLKGSAESASLALNGPFAYSIVNQKMEQRIIGGRNSAPQTGLYGFLILVRQVVGQSSANAIA